HDSFSVFLCQPKNTLILTFKSTSSINHQNTNVAMLNRSHRTHYRIELQIFFYFRFLTDSGCVNQVEFKTKTVIFRVDSISSCSRNISYDISVFTNKRIDETRFSCIWSSNHSKSWQVFICIFNSWFFRKSINQSVQKLSCSAS